MEPQSTKPRSLTGSGDAAAVVANRNTIFAEERRDNLQADIQTELVFQEQGDVLRVKGVKTFLSSLARLLDGERVASYVMSKLDEHLNDDLPNDQISFGLIRFFDQLKLEDSKWKWCRALKCINQEVIFPGVMALRKWIYYNPDNTERFPFQDSKNTWKIRVVASSEGCTIIHTKWEESRQSLFRFKWFFEVRVSSDGSYYGQARISNYSFKDTLTPEHKATILNSFRPFMTATADFESIWSKMPATSVLGNELVALTSALTICNQAGETLYTKELALGPATRARRILHTLAAVVQPDLIPTLMRLFEEHVKQEGDLAEQLARVFSNIPLDCRLLRLFRLLCADQLSPCVLRMKRVVAPVVGYRSEKKSHKVHVMLVLRDVQTPSVSATESSTASGRMLPPLEGAKLPNNEAQISPGADGNLAYVVVTHRKREISIKSSATDVFRFEWVLTLKARGLLEEMLSSDFRVINVEYEDETMPDLKNQVTEILSPYFAPKQIVDTLFRTSAEEILASLVESVPSSVQCYRPGWPFSIPATELLQRLRSELKTRASPDALSSKFVW